ELAEDVDTPAREGQAEQAAEERKQYALREKQPRNAPATGAESGAQSHFLVALPSAREQEIGDVGAGDKQDEGDGAKENQQRGANSFHHIFLKVRGKHRPAFEFVGIRLVDARSQVF